MARKIIRVRLSFCSNFYNRYLRTQSPIRTFTFKLLPLLVALLVAAGCRKEEAIDNRPLTAQERRGQRLYNVNCLQCHRADSEGPLNGPGLKNVYKKKFFPSGAPANDERMTDVIKHGRRQMPAFSDLSEAEIADMIAYMKRL